MGMIILAISRIIMYRSRKRISLIYWQYFVWLIAEISVISLVYTLIVSFFYGVTIDFIALFYISFRFTFLILSIPYTLSWLYFALREAQAAISAIPESDNFVDFSTIKPELFNFRDEKGTIRFTVSPNNIIYIESADNYVIIYYLNKKKISHFMLRNNLKNIDEKLHYPIVRCHRSFMINIEKINVIKRDKDGLIVSMDMESIPDIPVSKSYAEKIIELMPVKN
jgi:hypothetical protein